MPGERAGGPARPWGTGTPELDSLLGELVERTAEILGGHCGGVYVLHGSFAVGDVDEHRDCDFLVVVDRPLRPEWAQHTLDPQWHSLLDQVLADRSRGWDPAIRLGREPGAGVRVRRGGPAPGGPVRGGGRVTAPRTA